MRGCTWAARFSAAWRPSSWAPRSRIDSCRGGQMPHGFKGERTLMRIFIGESDKYHGKPLYEALLEKFGEKRLAGATVIRGVAGYGASSVVHTAKVLRLSLDLPLIIEVVETEEAIQAILPELDAMIGGGLVTLERARVILYRPANVRQDQRELHRIEGLEAE